MRAQLRALLAVPAVLAVVVGCATTTSDLTALRKRTTVAERDVRSAQRVGGRLDAWGKAVGGSGSPGDAVVFGRDALLQLVRQYLPYHFRGATVDKRLRGKFKLWKASNLTLLPRKRASLRLELTGTDVTLGVKGQASYKKMAKEAAAAGIVIDLLIELTTHYKANTLGMTARVTRVAMRKHNTSSNQSRLKAMLNQRFFNGRKYVPLPARLRGRKPQVFTTRNHVVIRPGA